ncbi:MAG: hypothetical protein HYV61_02380 [Candidatus Rokubacteria bacterium]|nr:hypothetical protein [Candidatus Rokubacteria bacterium]
MPDVWTRYPDIVRDLLEEGGFTCGVPPRVLKGRDPAWTCIIDGKRISGDLYIHHVDTLKSGLGVEGARPAALAGPGWGAEWLGLAVALLVAVVLLGRPPGRGPGAR